MEIRDLRLAYANVVLLEAFSCSLAAGTVLMVHGPSGCGKTTLLRTLAGLQAPDAGEIRFRNIPIEQLHMPSYRREVLLVSQQPLLTPGTVEENLRLPFTFRANHSASSNGAYPASRARELLKSLHLPAALLEQPASTLSVGQQQRVALLRALLLRPAVLLLDEPTASLDEHAAQCVEDCLLDCVRGEGVAALIVSHNRAQRERLADETIALKVPKYAG